MCTPCVDSVLNTVARTQLTGFPYVCKEPSSSPNHSSKGTARGTFSTSFGALVLVRGTIWSARRKRAPRDGIQQDMARPRCASVNTSKYKNDVNVLAFCRVSARHYRHTGAGGRASTGRSGSLGYIRRSVPRGRHPPSAHAVVGTQASGSRDLTASWSPGGRV